MPKALGKAEIGATAHGFRSSFKDWARHQGVDELLSEFALAQVEAKTVAAYGRDSLVEKRRPVMQAWCDHATGAPGTPACPDAARPADLEGQAGAEVVEVGRALELGTDVDRVLAEAGLDAALMQLTKLQGRSDEPRQRANRSETDSCRFGSRQDSIDPGHLRLG